MTAPVFLFSGQGSQVVGMASAFYAADAAAQAVFRIAEDVSGKPLKTLCFEGPEDTLTETENLQPAMTAAVLACYRAFAASGAGAPSFVAGHSLGEYAALAAAGVITDTACMELVTARGRLMQAAAEQHPGAMAAVMKMDPAAVAAIVDGLAADHAICLANLNAPEQLVVSGTEEAIEALRLAVAEAGGRFSKLKVSGAWHSPLMASASEAFATVLDGIPFADASVPVLLNVTGLPETDGAAIKAAMKLQMCSGVRWYPAMEHAWAQGARVFVEFGPKATLNRMMRYILPDVAKSDLHLIADPDGLAAWQANT